MTLEEIEKKLINHQKNLELLCEEINKSNKRITALEKENKRLKRKIKNAEIDIGFLETK